MFFWRLATEKLFCSAFHAHGEPGCLDHTASQKLLVATCSNYRQRSQEWVSQMKRIKEKYFHFVYIQHVSAIYQPLPPSPSCCCLRCYRGTCSDLMGDKVGNRGSQFGSPTGVPYSRGLREHLEGNIMKWSRSFPHFLQYTTCSVLELTNPLRIGTMCHSLPFLQCLAQGLAHSSVKCGSEQAVNPCWEPTVC